MGGARGSLRARVGTGLGLGVLLGLHLDAWRPAGWPGEVGGVPGEVVYRLAWMGLAYGFLAWVLGGTEAGRERGER